MSGPLTATELADRLDETPANCSWHLRKLAEHSFVEEAGGGIGRQRPWRVRSVGLAWDDADASPSELRAGRALEDLLLQRQVTRYQQARAQLHDEGDREWSDAASSTQHASWLTVDELDDARTSRSAPSSSGTPTGSPTPRSARRVPALRARRVGGAAAPARRRGDPAVD